MPKILCISNMKGGVGKSTLSLSLASCFKNELKVGLVDIDMQGSLTALKLMADGINLIPYKNSFNEALCSKDDIIIIDTPPYLSSELPEIFMLSDFVLIPTKVGFFDFMAINPTLALVYEAKGKKKDLKAGIVFNQVKHNSSISTELKGAINDDSIPVMHSIITDRVSYTRSAICGGIFNTNDSKAKDEIINLADEIFKMIGI